MRKTIRLQHREYADSNGIIKYRQHRINLPEKIIKEIGWDKENHITISIKSRNSKKTISLKIKD